VDIQVTYENPGDMLQYRWHVAIQVTCENTGAM